MLLHNSLGICVGASTVSSVNLLPSSNTQAALSTEIIQHHGNPKLIVEKIFQNGIPEKVVVTGRKFRRLLNVPSISEPEAIELALEYLKLDADLIVSAGGENFIAYQLDNNRKITKCITGNKCASGTGEFFLQQIRRMNLDVEDAIQLGCDGEPYNISGRCSVFCKSDCTHALNKGVPKKDVVAGLSRMMAQKIIELISKTHVDRIILIGGVSRNESIIRFLKEQINDIIIPPESAYIEALGAAIFASKNNLPKINKKNIFRSEHSAFSFHEDLKKFVHKVTFKDFERGTANPNDVCILGLDVGSTTTKVILMRKDDCAILASEYLRTNGDPIQASVECYKSLVNQLSVLVKIIGLGVTGSGRHISGLHAQSKGIVNEILAHANATVYFDKDVDTIFEIGGQDAKYTYITAGVPSDYAMNEACSAGTGSFLEEAAKESLNVDYLSIAEIALQADHPPNFNDQCSAFISSDIKNALHEGLSKENIIAGLVYSICLNYTNRVKGNRPVGEKVFMQGGVCYNKAVPIAMAALTGKEIIVPPEPGLMGAFGVALEIKKRIELGFIQEQNFDLDGLINRKVEYGKSFICAGGAEKCDRKCSIAIIEIENKKFPFGGACNKYYEFQQTKALNIKERNIVKLRQELVFDKYVHAFIPEVNIQTIGISKSFLTNTFYPLFHNFFNRLGFTIILGSEPVKAGIEKQNAAFCYPVELAHGFFQDLIDKQPHYIFLPHIIETYVKDSVGYTKNCVFIQSESYYLKTAFKDSLGKIKILNPVINFSKGYESSKDDFINLAVELGQTEKKSSEAFDLALKEFKLMLNEFKEIGKRTLDNLEQNPDDFAVVLFGRSYNSFADEANLGIPQKFASRGMTIIPHDFLPSENLGTFDTMYWAAGKQILRSAKFVKDHPQLFGVYITNFSCGPDSFLITFFRNIMGNKPSLTLELDSHSADAGINTRIEAALDIIKRYRELSKKGIIKEEKKNFKPLEFVDAYNFICSDGKKYSIKDKDVKMLIPSMGRFGTEAFTAAFRHINVNAIPLPVYDYQTLSMGRGNTTCKECLPLILNTGSFLEYLGKHRNNESEKILYFMADGTGPCRFGQYNVFLKELINKKEIPNVGIYTLTEKNSYGGLDDEFTKRGWAALVTADVIQQIFFAMLTIAKDPKYAKAMLDEEWKKILLILEKGSLNELYDQLDKLVKRLRTLERRIELNDAVKVALIGEIFVRNEEFSRMELVERLIENGILVKVAPITEYVHYSNYVYKLDLKKDKASLKEKVKFKIRKYVQHSIEHNIKKALSKSGFYEFEMINIEKLLSRAEHLIEKDMEGEAILTVGSAFYEILDHVSGVVALGPFGCMPSRLAESILSVEMNLKGKRESEKNNSIYQGLEIENLPFLAVETDGNIFPQIIQSKIEIFIQQVHRTHKKLRDSK